MAKLCFHFRHVSPTYYEVSPLCLPNDESNLSTIPAFDFLSAVGAYVDKFLEPADIRTDLLKNLPFASDFFVIGSGSISEFIRSLASIPPSSGFDNFNFVGLDHNSFVIELSMDQSISHYFIPNDSTHESKEQKKKA